jgi:hypothetical protein
MTFFRRDPHSQIESELREARPQSPAGLVESIRSEIGSQRPVRRRGSLRLGLALAATVAVVGATAAVGGASYATSSATRAVEAVAHVVVHPAVKSHAATVRHLSSALSAAKHQYHKVHMCHDKHINIEVAPDDVAAHLAEGDTLGKCKKHHHH